MVMVKNVMLSIESITFSIEMHIKNVMLSIESITFFTTEKDVEISSVCMKHK